MKIRIKHILRCYQSGMSIRSISSSLLISRNTVKRYIRVYEDMGIELERLLKMDDHHLHELPLETQNTILDWVFWNFYPAQKVYPHLTSDDLKEVLYKRTQIHLHNNQFKEAMLINGFWPRDPSELNWVFHIQASSPAIRTQADGYPGIPIIGRQELNEYRKKSCARR